jgi:hypothetical protein
MDIITILPTTGIPAIIRIGIIRRFISDTVITGRCNDEIFIG